MPDWLTYKGIDVPYATPSGAAGLKLKTDLTELTDRAPYKTNADPTSTDDADDGFAAGSRWLNTSSAVMWVCVDPTAGAAVWRTLDKRASGALILCPSGASGTRGLQIDSSGNSRGTDAIDLQTSRTNNSEVASGTRAFLAGCHPTRNDCRWLRRNGRSFWTSSLWWRGHQRSERCPMYCVPSISC